MRLHIFDMDGTIVDSLHRYRTVTDLRGNVRIDLPHWRANEDKCHLDTRLPLADEYDALCESDNDYVIIATARVFCHKCHDFVGSVIAEPQHIVSRAENDTSGGVDLKWRGIIHHLANMNRAANPIHSAVVYEDNETYLNGLLDRFAGVGIPAIGRFIASEQGY